MNVFELLQGQGLELSKIQQLFEEQDFDALYEEYADVISELLFLESKEEFEDFINEEGNLEIEPFLFAYASSINICLSIGMYEENVAELIRNYTNIGMDVELSDDVEAMTENIAKINKTINNSGKKYITFFDDTYCEGCYYIFKVEIGNADDNWDGEMVERLI